MPLYEYRCNQCRKRVSVLVKSFSQEPTPVCDRCQSTDLRRLVSTFSFHRSWGDSLGLPSSFEEGGDDDEDPRATAQWLRRMKGEMGDVTPEYDDMIDRLEAGDMPEDGEDGDFDSEDF